MEHQYIDIIGSLTLVIRDQYRVMTAMTAKIDDLQTENTTLQSILDSKNQEQKSEIEG